MLIRPISRHLPQIAALPYLCPALTFLALLSLSVFIRCAVHFVSCSTDKIHIHNPSILRHVVQCLVFLVLSMEPRAVHIISKHFLFCFFSPQASVFSYSQGCALITAVICRPISLLHQETPHTEPHACHLSLGKASHDFALPALAGLTGTTIVPQAS